MSNIKANLYNVYLNDSPTPIPVVAAGFDGIAQILMDEDGVLPKLKEIQIVRTDLIMPSYGLMRSINKNNVVTELRRADKKFVRFCLGKIDIAIDLHDAPRRLDWYEGNRYVKGKGMRLFSQEEGMAMYIYKDEINAKLVELGGEPLRDGWYLTSTEYSSSNAWRVNFLHGYVDRGNKYFGSYVRAVAASNQLGA
jgi:hypothetical protein